MGSAEQEQPAASHLVDAITRSHPHRSGARFPHLNCAVPEQQARLIHVRCRLPTGHAEKNTSILQDRQGLPRPQFDPVRETEIAPSVPARLPNAQFPPPTARMNQGKNATVAKHCSGIVRRIVLIRPHAQCQRRHGTQLACRPALSQRGRQPRRQHQSPPQRSAEKSTRNRKRSGERLAHGRSLHTRGRRAFIAQPSK